jgi:hypothetical protein
LPNVDVEFSHKLNLLRLDNLPQNLVSVLHIFFPCHFK